MSIGQVATRGDDLEHRIARTILSLLDARAADATICPSEVARKVSPVGWRPLMPLVRAAALKLAAEGRLEVRQRKALMPAGTALKGPIRLAKASRR